MSEMNALSSVDHLVWAVPQLESSMEVLQQRTGVTPMLGGRHPNWGTHNAVISLSERTYLELIAPDPDSKTPSENRPQIFSALESPRMIGWFAKCDQLETACQAAASVGIHLGSIQPGARNLPDGRTLRWQLTDPMVMVFDGIFPMLIHWGDSPHPASSAPSGCQLLELHLEHPQGPDVTTLLNTIGISIGVQKGPVPIIRAIIETPVGTIQLP